MYQWLEYGEIPNSDFDTLWQVNMPLKVKIFVWLVRRNRVLTEGNLSKQGWSAVYSVFFCDLEETTDYLFAICPFISKMW
jgi:zinc-binding in reverse transcriptase